MSSASSDAGSMFASTTENWKFVRLERLTHDRFVGVPCPPVWVTGQATRPAIKAARERYPNVRGRKDIVSLLDSSDAHRILIHPEIRKDR